MTREEIIRNLKYTMQKHKNDTVSTFGTNISVMCKDILDYLEQEPCEGRMKYVQETVNTIMNSCKTDSIKDKCFRNAARFIQNAIDGSNPEFELINDVEPCEDCTCEDCISRAEAIKSIRNYTVIIEVGRAIGKSQLVDILDSINKVQEKMISELPRIQPKSMQVELEGDGYADGKLVYDYGKCPKCGWEFEYGDKDWEQPYCCHCGQRLKWFESEEQE